MAACDACGSTILFGGTRDGELRFCNDKCSANGGLLRVAANIPPSVLSQHVSRVYHGACPKCQGAGPVDVHTSHRVWSLLFLTSWKSIPQVSCRACGVKSQLGSAAFSLVAGWWGIPWGLVMTPVQIVRNLVGATRGPSEHGPSKQLEKLVSINLAAQTMR